MIDLDTHGMVRVETGDVVLCEYGHKEVAGIIYKGNGSIELIVRDHQGKLVNLPRTDCALSNAYMGYERAERLKKERELYGSE